MKDAYIPLIVLAVFVVLFIVIFWLIKDMQYGKRIKKGKKIKKALDENTDKVNEILMVNGFSGCYELDVKTVLYQNKIFKVKKSAVPLYRILVDYDNKKIAFVRQKNPHQKGGDL